MAKSRINQAYESRPIYSIRDLTDLVTEIGFLPFFQNVIQGFSIDEATPAEVWDAYLGLGPWLWRDDIAREKKCIYGKFFNKKTGYVSIDMFPDFANYRRDGYDFDARYDDGLIRHEDKTIYDLIERNGAMTAVELKRKLGIDSKKTSNFDGRMTRLQMMTYIVPVDFIFAFDENGEKKYSYGTTVYDLPERWLGEYACRSRYDCSPEESLDRCIRRLMKMLPDHEYENAKRLLR